MGTRRSRHNKGRKPFYKEHRIGLFGTDDEILYSHETIGNDALPENLLASVRARVVEGRSLRELCKEFSLERKTLFRLKSHIGYDNIASKAARSHRASVRSKTMHADPEFKARAREKQKAKWARMYKYLGIDSGRPTVAPSGSAEEILLRCPEPAYWRFWAGQDLADLRVVAETGAPIARVAKIFGRTERAVADKARLQGIIIPKEWRALLTTDRPRERPLVLAYPYVKKATPDTADLLRANDLVPKGMPESMRADICQSVMLALYEGTVTLDEIEANKTKLRWFIKKFHHDQTPWQEVAGYGAGDDDERPYHDVAADWKKWEQNEARMAWETLWHDGGRASAGTQEDDAHEMLLTERIEAWAKSTLDVSEEDVASMYENKGHDDNSGRTIARLRSMIGWNELFKQQHGRCAYCNCSMTVRRGFPNTVTRDHVVPLSAGGTDDDANLVGACLECNQRKGSMSVQEFLALIGNKSIHLHPRASEPQRVRS